MRKNNAEMYHLQMYLVPLDKKNSAKAEQVLVAEFEASGFTDAIDRAVEVLTYQIPEAYGGLLTKDSIAINPPFVVLIDKAKISVPLKAFSPDGNETECLYYSTEFTSMGRA